MDNEALKNLSSFIKKAYIIVKTNVHIYVLQQTFPNRKTIMQEILLSRLSLLR